MLKLVSDVVVNDLRNVFLNYAIGSYLTKKLLIDQCCHRHNGDFKPALVLRLILVLY